MAGVSNLYLELPRRLPPKFVAFWLSRKFAVAEYAIAAQVSCLDDSPESFTQIRRNAVTIVQILCCRNEFSFRFKHHEVGIEAFCDAPFASVASGELRRAFRHPERDIRKRKSVGAGLRPHYGKRQREADNPSPRGSKALLTQSLHFGWTRRMVGRYQINESFSKTLPKLFAILPVAHRGSAFAPPLTVVEFL